MQEWYCVVSCTDAQAVATDAEEPGAVLKGLAANASFEAANHTLAQRTVY